MKYNTKDERRILRNYRRFADAKLSPFSQNIYNLISNGTDYPDPTPTMLVFLDAIGEYNKLLSPALNKDKQTIALKNQVKGALIALLDELANYCTLKAKGNLAMLMKSGFDVNKINGTIVIDTPLIKFTNGDNPGELTTTAKDAKNVNVFVHQITPDPMTEESIWESKTTTRRAYTFTGLPKAKNFWGRIIAVGGNGQMKISLPSSRIVQ